MPNPAYLFVAGEPVEGGEMLRFVLQFPGTPAQAQGYVDANKIGGKKFVLDPKPINEKDPLILCQHFKPKKSAPAHLEEGEELLPSGESDSIFDDPEDVLDEE